MLLPQFTMKKILSTMMLMLFGIAAWAQDWTAPGNQDYTGSTPVYVQVNVNGVEQLKTQVAAFIDGDCRAVSYSAEAVVGSNQYHQLRVWGDPRYQVSVPDQPVTLDCILILLSPSSPSTVT